MSVRTVYGIGGFDPSKPNDNIVEQIELPDPEPTETEVVRESAMQKLAALGLTADEIAVLLSN